MLGEAIVD